MIDLKAKKTLLSCPGDTIQETINETGMSQAELAERIGRSKEKLNELIKGKAPITNETATKLEYVLGISANFWLNLERQYQDELLEIKQMDQLEQYKDWVSGFPLGNLKKLGVLPKINIKIELAKSLLKFFRVASPQQWSEIYKGKSLAFKIELRHTTEPQAISAWLRLGEIQAEKLFPATFNKKIVKKKLYKIQLLSYKKPDNWLKQLQKICSECGIALVYTPCISKAPVYGASRWIKGNSIPLIQITDRQKDYNAFWFTFYHELAHILYHGKKDIFIEGIENINPDLEKEKQADTFAANKILSEKERDELFEYCHFDTELILKYSKKIQKHPGILVAQVQRKFNQLYKDKRLNKLKAKVIFEELKV